MNRRCDQCGKPLITHRRGARFCDDRCRVKWHNGRRHSLDLQPVKGSLTTLYRLFDASGRLLYVGITSRNPIDRLRAHSRTRWWWEQAVSVRLEHFHSREEAQAAESAAIKDEHPAYNVAGVPI